MSILCSVHCLRGFTKPEESAEETAPELLGAQMRNALNNLTDFVTDESRAAALELLGTEMRSGRRS